MRKNMNGYNKNTAFQASARLQRIQYYLEIAHWKALSCPYHFLLVKWCKYLQREENLPPPKRRMEATIPSSPSPVCLVTA